MREQHHFTAIRVEVLKFKEKLIFYELFEWLQTLKRVFDYKGIYEVKLVSLKLRKYAYIWCINFVAK